MFEACKLLSKASTVPWTTPPLIPHPDIWLCMVASPQTEGKGHMASSYVESEIMEIYIKQ